MGGLSKHQYWITRLGELEWPGHHGIRGALATHRDSPGGLSLPPEGRHREAGSTGSLPGLAFWDLTPLVLRAEGTTPMVLLERSEKLDQGPDLWKLPRVCILSFLNVSTLVNASVSL